MVAGRDGVRQLNLEYPRAMRPKNTLLCLALLVTACSENALIAKDGDPPSTFDDVNPDILVDPPSVPRSTIFPFS